MQLQLYVQLNSTYLSYSLHLVKHDLYMFVCFCRYILVINPMHQEFMWRTISNLYVMHSRIYTQFFHNYHLQFIKGLQPMINLSIIALYTWPFKWQSLIRIGIVNLLVIVNLLESSIQCLLENILSSQSIQHFLYKKNKFQFIQRA